MSAPSTTSPSTRAARHCGPKPGIRPSKSGRRRTFVLLAVHVAIAAHLAHWWLAGETLSPLEPSEAMELPKSGIVNAGLVFFALMILSTAVFGRWFCGWGCHIVALQDGSRWLLGKIGIRPKPFRSRVLLAVPFLAFGWMFLWPFWHRIRHELGFEYQGTHLTTTGFWDTFPPWPIAVLTFLFSGFAIVYFLGAKGFCNYACPYGAIFGVVDRLATGRIRVTDACEGCGHCTAVCTSNVLVHAEVRDFGAVVDPACMKCMDCVSVCPKDALYFGFGKPELLTRARVPAAIARLKLRRWSDFGWREELLLAGLFLLGYLVYHQLFNRVPFLFSLAIAGIFAFLGLKTAQLFYRSNVNVQRFVVKRNGRLTRAGMAFAASALVGVAFTGYAARVQLDVRALDRGFVASDPLLNAWWEAPGRELSEQERASVRAALARAERLERIAPFADPRLPQRQAVLELLLGNAPAFVAHLERAMVSDPERALFPLTLAHYRAVMREPDAAFELYGRALVLDPDLDAERERVLQYAQYLGEPQRARVVFERVLAAHPDHQGALTGLVASLGASGSLQEALQHQLELVRRAPENPDARLLAAELAAALERWELCAEQLDELCRLSPELPSAWIFLSQALERLGQQGRAVEARARGEALLRDQNLPRPAGPR